MAFTVEDGTGVPGANAYMAVADVTAYFVEQETGTSFAGLASDTAREQAIVTATRYLERRYAREYRGIRAAGPDDQGLSWPRTSAYDDDGYTFGEDEVPTPVKEACAELAELVAGGTDLEPNPTVTATAAGMVTRERRKIGPIEREYTYIAGSGQVPRFRKIERIISQAIYLGQAVDRA